MKIGPVPPDRLGQTNDTTAKRSKITVQNHEKPRDRIEVSQDAMRKLSEMADQTRRGLLSRTSEADTSPQAGDMAGNERIARLRQRVQSGYYARPEVVRQIADSLADDIKP